MNKLLNKTATDTQGIMDSAVALTHYTLERYQPSARLASFVEYYWIVRWDLSAGASYTTEIIPFPNVNVAITSDEATITGPITTKYTRTLSGSGVVVGIKFLPGGFQPFYAKPMERLTNQTVQLKTVFPASRIKKVTALLGESDTALVDEVERLLLSKRPQKDDTIGAVSSLIDAVKQDRALQQVQAVCDAFDVSERTVQHAFKKYVGIGLKWIIMRYRLQDVAQAIEGGATNWATLAVDYGFSDQAHLIREFKKVTGETPATYSKRINASS